MLIHTHLAGHTDVPVEQAWGFMRDIKMLPMWHVGVVEAKDIAGAFDQIGSTATLVLKAPDGLHDFHIEVTGVEPFAMTRHVGRQVDGPMGYATTIHYTPAGRGFDWVWDQDYELPDIPGPFGNETLMTRVVENMVRQSTENHTLLLEALVPQPA